MLKKHSDVILIAFNVHINFNAFSLNCKQHVMFLETLHSIHTSVYYFKVYVISVISIFLQVKCIFFTRVNTGQAATMASFAVHTKLLTTQRCGVSIDKMRLFWDLRMLLCYHHILIKHF